jgi:hypothetical protein
MWRRARVSHDDVPLLRASHCSRRIAALRWRGLLFCRDDGARAMPMLGCVFLLSNFRARRAQAY